MMLIEKKIFSGTEITMWEFHDFSITHFLREINFGDATSAKSAILTHLEARNFEVLHFLKAEIHNP